MATSSQLTIVIVLPVLILLVQELVEAVELLLLGAVQVVPPVTDKVLLVKEGAIGTQESKLGWLPTVFDTYVKNLQAKRICDFIKCVLDSSQLSYRNN